MRSAAVAHRRVHRVAVADVGGRRPCRRSPRPRRQPRSPSRSSTDHRCALLGEAPAGGGPDARDPPPVISALRPASDAGHRRPLRRAVDHDDRVVGEHHDDVLAVDEVRLVGAHGFAAGPVEHGEEVVPAGEVLDRHAVEPAAVLGMRRMLLVVQQPVGQVGCVADEWAVDVVPVLQELLAGHPLLAADERVELHHGAVFPHRSSVEPVTAVHADHLAGDRLGQRRGQEHHRAGDLARSAAGNRGTSRSRPRRTPPGTAHPASRPGG